MHYYTKPTHHKISQIPLQTLQNHYSLTPLSVKKGIDNGCPFNALNSLMIDTILFSSQRGCGGASDAWRTGLQGLEEEGRVIPSNQGCESRLASLENTLFIFLVGYMGFCRDVSFSKYCFEFSCV